MIMVPLVINNNDICMFVIKTHKSGLSVESIKNKK